MTTPAERIGDGSEQATGRWRLNSGSEMLLNVPGLSDEPIRAVIDLASATFLTPRIVALDDHEGRRVVGYWDKGEITGKGIEADLHLMQPKDEVEANVLAEAVRVAAIARSGVPIQVSVGAEPGPSGTWEHIAPGLSVELNGRTYQGGDDGLYVLRGAQIYEASIVTFGADSVTGRIAARHNPPVLREAPMSDTLKKLLGKHPEKRHGLVARLVAEGNDEATIDTKVKAADDAEKDAEREAEMAALKAERDDLKTKCAEMEEKLKQREGAYEQPTSGSTAVAGKAKTGTAAEAARGSTKGVQFGGTDGAEASDKAKPKTVSQAMALEIEAGNTLRGFKLREAVIRKYQNLERA